MCLPRAHAVEVDAPVADIEPPIPPANPLEFDFLQDLEEETKEIKKQKIEERKRYKTQPAKTIVPTHPVEVVGSVIDEHTKAILSPDEAVDMAALLDEDEAEMAELQASHDKDKGDDELHSVSHPVVDGIGVGEPSTEQSRGAYYLPLTPNVK